jgi:hypothetical protein
MSATFMTDCPWCKTPRLAAPAQNLQCAKCGGYWTAPSESPTVTASQEPTQPNPSPQLPPEEPGVRRREWLGQRRKSERG